MAKTPLECSDIFIKLVDGLNINSHSVCILLNTIKSRILPSSIPEKRYDIKYLKNGPSFAKQFEKKSILDHSSDKKDLKIMNLLSKNAKLNLSEIGKELSLTNDAIRYRVRKLIGSKYILQFRPVINYALLNFSIQTVLIKSSHREEKDNEDFKRFLKEEKNILWSTEIMGGRDYLVYVIIKDQEQIHTFIDNLKSKFEGYIDSYEILFAFKEYKYSFMADSIE